MTTRASTRSTGGGRLDDVPGSVNPGRRLPRRRARGRRSIRALAGGGLVLLAGAVPGADLLRGTMPDGNGTEMEFGLEGEDREDVVGGRIVLGETGYEISRVSRLGLIGARRFVAGGDAREPYAEFLVLSSSFSDQTAVGAPWVAAREAHGCEEPYNTFVALYRVEGDAKVKALGPIPYPQLVEDASRSHDSRVFCFIARPPG